MASYLPLPPIVSPHMNTVKGVRDLFIQIARGAIGNEHA